MIPILLTAYYILTWVFYLGTNESPNKLNFGSPGASQVFYSWVVLGVFGLDMGEYALLGVEASMLMELFWAAPNAWHVMMHGDHSWNGIDGW